MDYIKLFKTGDIIQHSDATRVDTPKIVETQTLPTVPDWFKAANPTLTPEELQNKYQEQQNQINRQTTIQQGQTSKTPYEQQQSDLKRKQVEVQEQAEEDKRKELEALKLVNTLGEFTSPSTYVELFSGKDLNGGQEFAADVLLDPSLYLSAGVTPLIKTSITKGVKTASRQIPKFTTEQLLEQAKKAYTRTINDAEYLESLSRELGLSKEQAQIVMQRQLNALSNTSLGSKIKKEVDLDGMTGITTFNNSLGTDLYKQFQTKQDFINYYQGLSDAEKMQFEKALKYGSPEIHINERLISNDEIRNVFKHELGHAANGGGLTPSIIQKHNSKYPVELTPVVNKNYIYYYSDPDELRARSMKLRRLHQTTGKSYEELLNDPLLRNDTDFKELQDLYNREQLINYLNHFVQNEAPKINYIDNFTDNNYA